jgi:hypothetical protein
VKSIIIPRSSGWRPALYREGQDMRVFLASVLAAVILALGALFALNTTQRTAATAYTTEGARINPAWSWRRILRRSVDQAAVGQKLNAGAGFNPSGMRLNNDQAAAARDACEETSALSMLFVDFGDSATGDEGAHCGS